jgi:CheY-specific phosphatase CheX
MNKAAAKKIAASITRDQLSEMMQSAKLRISDWTAVSSVNPYVSKGKAWNIFYPVFVSGRAMSIPAITNMVWEFGDYLADDLKPKKSVPSKHSVLPLHEEPVFGVS